MHNELRYRAKMYTISEKLKKKKFASSPQLFFFFFANNKIKKQQGNAYGKGNNI
jgi:hypothetical protein